LTRLVILDAGPVGLGGKPRGRPDVERFHAWVEALLDAGDAVAVPEIARYEVRRELFRVGASGGLRRLDFLRQRLGFLPITGEIMDIASELWGIVRRGGLPTADDKALDGDAILAATAIVAAAGAVDEVIIATNNVAHLARFPGVDAREWWTIV
jgi:predicted nucleic acid-binding protein